MDTQLLFQVGCHFLFVFKIMSARIDLTGNKYSRLTVIGFSHRGKKQTMWECVCDCGNKCVAGGYDIRSGNTKSCGCLNVEHQKFGSITHGKARTRIYRIWCGLFNRCYNEKHDKYKNYGARGIIVCERWHKFENFYEDTKDGYAENLSLDRFPNKDGNYEPTNCRWATQTVQCRNRTNNHLVSINGETKCLTEWLSIYKIQKSSFRKRVKKGMSEVDALIVPPRRW